MTRQLRIPMAIHSIQPFNAILLLPERPFIFIIYNQLNYPILPDCGALLLILDHVLRLTFTLLHRLTLLLAPTHIDGGALLLRHS
jgi:hypothetical protein